MNNMEISKPNDILVTTLNNPGVTPYDLLSKDINGENTSLFTKEQYKESDYIKNVFKGEDGKFDDIAFNDAYKLAENNFYNLTNEQYLKDLDKIEYSPFDVTRPKFAKTFKVSANIEKEYNPFETKKGWTGIDSIDESNLSLREIAQKSKVYDPITNSWSKQSLNDLSILDKLFGETLVYAQFEEDGEHLDPFTGYMTSHKKGEWKVNDDGNLYTEKISDKNIYGKQVVSTSDILTTDGSLVDQFNFLDSDGRQKSIAGTVFKLSSEIAPFLMPKIGTYYAGVKTAVSLISVLPTFYKAIEGAFLGDEETSLTKGATQMENWMSKFNQNSVSDQADSLLSFEQMSGMVSDIFSQIYEQRSAASLSKMIMKGDKLMDDATEKLAKNINGKLLEAALSGKINMADIPNLSKAAMLKIPQLQSVIARQSQLSKSLSLGYMALTSTSDIYGQALLGGYDRRTAGFAALASMAGQYTIMMNNRMGDWFLDKTTGYSNDINRALINKAVTPWLDDVEKGFVQIMKGEALDGKKSLGKSFKNIRTSIHDFFTTPSVIAESIGKNAIIEGVEEVTEQMVLDTTKGVVDVLSYLGVTKGKGSFGGFDNVFSKQGAENYLANLVGGIVGGGMFEFHRSQIEPYFNPKSITPETKKSLYELVAGGHKEEIIKVINKARPNLGNKYISDISPDGTFLPVDEKSRSQADTIADKAIEMINTIDNILNIHDIGKSDEEIVMKAIRDKIIIDNLNKTAPEGKTIGLEGLILEDYKTRMYNVVNLELELKRIDETVEGKKAGEGIKEQLKLNIDAINDILEGKNASKYFRQATWYLNKKISGAFVNMDKAEYVKHKYGVDITSLPLTGVGLTQESINKEWQEHIESKDLRKDLNIADGVYLEVEKMLNGYISDYVTTGYVEEHTKTLKNILDLKETINVFNTSESENDKKLALERFIQINNELESQKQGIVSPWTILHNDIYDQLNNLGLVKKVKYNVNSEGLVIEDIQDFSSDELKEIIEDKQVSTEEYNKLVVQNFFKKFPLNSLNAENLVNKFNNDVFSYNKNILQKISALESKSDITPEEEIQLSKLKSSIINIKIDSINNTPIISGLIKSAEDKIEELFTNNGITTEKYQAYQETKKSKQLFTQTFEEILKKYNVSNWNQLDQLQLLDLFKVLQESGLYDNTINELLKTSENVEQSLEDLLIQLSSEELSLNTLEEIKGKLERFFDTLKNNIDNSVSLLQDNVILDIEKEILNINKSLKEETDKVKPEILKLHNYAFELLMDQLVSGNNDNEVFLEAEKLFNEELSSFISNLFPNGKNITLQNVIKIIELLPKIIKAIDSENEESEGDPSAYEYDSIIKEVLLESEELYKTDPNYKGIFQDKETLDFIKNNFDENLNLGILKNSLEKVLQSFNLNKRNFDNINKFLEIQSKLTTLKSNTLYDFIKKFTLTLNSNPNNKVTKIFDILKREELTLKSSSNITNYLSDGVRESDINQALDHLEMIKAVVSAMATTTVDYDDPIGFISARQKFAKKYNLEDDVLNLKTITSDVATMMLQDLDLVINKLSFLKNLSTFNAGKMMNEQEIIRERVEEILLVNWKIWTSKLNPSFLPTEKIKEILISIDTNAKKLMKIESLVFEYNIDKKSESFENFLNELDFTDAEDSSKIDKEVTSLSNWDLATYYATVLSIKSEDFHIRTHITINGTFSKAPFFTQELVAKITKASTVNPELFAKIYSFKKNSNKLSADFITIILGNAGSGKTSAVFGLDLEHFKQTNENTNIWFSAPTDLQTNALEKAIAESNGQDKITSKKYLKNELFEKLGILQLINEIEDEISTISTNKVEKNVRLITDPVSGSSTITLTDNILNNKWIETIIANLENLPNLLLIDEITHYSFIELYLLNAISKYSFNNLSLNFMKIIGAGDDNQLGYLSKIDNKYYEYNISSVNAIFTPKLWASVRSSNNQQRINTERFVRITRDVTKMYKDNKGDHETSNSEALKYLETNKELNTLSYFEDDNTINGSKIITELDKKTVNTLKNIIQKDSSVKIGILTKDNKLPEKWNSLLTDAGIITPDSMNNIIMYNPKNIQGSEVDYFIFDAKLIDVYDKIRDNLKAFYTFMSRSKKGTIIVDQNNILKTDYKIENGLKDNYTTTFEPMTPAVIEQAKETKREFLKSLLSENPKPSETDNFKWKVGAVDKTEEEPIIEAQYVQPIVKKKSIVTKVKQLKDAETSDFKPMFYTFYNNPNVFIDESGIKVNNNNLPFDLNGLINSSTEDYKKVIEEWTLLKNYILFNQTESSVLSTKYKSYLEHIFGKIENTEHIDFEIIVTATNFDKEVNSPYQKKGLETSRLLKTGDPFINLTAKITLGQKTHYITLATLGSKEKILDKATKMNQSTDKIEERFNNIEKSLKTKHLLEFKIKDVNSIQIITSTLINDIFELDGVTKKKFTFPLTTLKEEFPGMYFSEIRFFPGNETVFRNLINQYTFGEKRTEEQIKEDYDLLKNKSYIVVSYKDDLNGTSSNKTQANLVPIGSNKRSLKVLTEEVNNLLEERKNSLSETNKTINPELNAKTESLLNRSDILDVLIHWATTSDENGTLLDSLFKEITFSFSDKVTGNKTSVFSIFNRLHNNAPLSNERLKIVIDKLKSEIKKGTKPEQLKSNLIQELKGITGWHWAFFNIFGYEKLIKKEQDKEILKIITNEVLTDSTFKELNDSQGGKEMLSIIEKLMKSIENKAFYYSVPIQAPKIKGGAYISNPFISGENGYSENTFGDKFFINVAPESPRLLMNLNEFLDLEEINNTIKKNPKIEPEVEIKVESKVEIIDEEATLINFTNSFINDETKINWTTLSNILENLITLEVKLTLQELLNNQVYIASNSDSKKVEMILKKLGIKTKNGISDGLIKIELSSIAPAFNLDKLIDKNLIIAINSSVEDLLKKCKK